MSSKVKVVNSVWNGNGLIRRKLADFYVAEGRAVYVGQDQLRLVESHPKNQAAAERAAAWVQEHCPPGRDRISRALERYGVRVLDRHGRPCGLEATDNPGLNFRPIRRKPCGISAKECGRCLKVCPWQRLGEPKVLRGTRLPHENAKPPRPTVMQRIATRERNADGDVKLNLSWVGFGAAKS